MLFAVVLALALLLHVLLGWQWTILAGVVYGFFGLRRAWITAALACALSWSLLVLWNFAVAPLESGRMTEAVGGLLGNIPSWAVVAVTMLLGALCGLVGALIGRRLSILFRKPRHQSTIAGTSPFSFLKTPSSRD